MTPKLFIPAFLLMVLLIISPVLADDPWEGWVPPSINGTVPLTVNFTDISYNSPTAWNWSYRDVTGNNTEIWFSQERNTTFTFSLAGNFSIRLNASNSYGFNITPELVYVNASGIIGVPVSSFTSNVTSGAAPLVVQFNDTSTNAPLAWCWTYSNLSYTSQYPPAQDDTYVKSTSQYSSFYQQYYATDPTKNLTGGAGNNSWASTSTTNQRFHIDLGSKKLVSRVYYENLFFGGGITTRGARHFTMWGTDDASAFADIVYDNDTGWTQLTTSESEFAQHPSYPELPDPHYFTVSNNSGYRYYGFKIADNWGGTTFMGLRRIELQSDTEWFSAEQNPIHTFNAGNWSISLNVSNSAGYNINSGFYFINASGNVTPAIIPIAGFTSNVTTVYNSGAVLFTDESLNSPTSWQWEICYLYACSFQYTQNATKTFPQISPYDYYANISLTATNDAGSNTTTATNYIHVIDTSPPGEVTSLIDTDRTTSSLLWGWIPPSDYDLDHYIVYKDGAWSQNLTGVATSLNWTGLSSSTNYTIGIQTVDLRDNIGSAIINLTASTSPLPETVPPGGITGLTSDVPGSNSIRWRWINPTNESYDHLVVYKNGTWYQNLSSAYTSVNWSGLQGNTSYEFAARSADDLGIIYDPWVNLTVTTQPSFWEWTEPGYHEWVCPSDITQVFLNIGAGAGSGRASYSRGWGGADTGGVQYYNYSGLGGNAGEWENISPVDVIPGQVYAMYVGKGGDRQEHITIYDPYPPYANPTGNNGEDSAAFATDINATNFLYRKLGGLGGLGNAPTNNGGDGIGLGFLTTVKLAEDGMSVGPYLGGIAPVGYSAPGGGAPYDDTWTAYGGKGANGYIGITDLTLSIANFPDFSADITSGSPGSLIHFTDLSTIKTSGNLTYLWDFGDGLTLNTTGSTIHVYSYTGVYTVSLTLTSDSGTVTETKSNYIVMVTQHPVTLPSTLQVRITVFDWKGSNVVGATVSANYIETTLPDAILYLVSLYGVSSEVAAEMLSTNITMSGTTGSDGAIVFTMHSSLKYNITVTSGTTVQMVSLYPKETDYNIWLTKPVVPNIYEEINYTLTFTEPNISYMTLGAQYIDPTSKTSSLLFYVNTSNGTPVYSQNLVPGTSLLTVNKTLPNIRGQSYYWGIRGDRTDGANVAVDRGVTAKGPNGVLIDLWLPNTSYYPWIAFLILALICSLASKVNIRFLAPLMIIMAAIFWWFGWLQGTYLSAVIPFCGFLSAIYYMKGSLRENYGIGGPGSILITILVYLIIFQMMIGFIAGLGIFSQQAMVTPSNEFSNADLTTLRTDMENFGGINDPLQSANSFASIGYATIKIAINMVGAVFVIAIYLTEMFPYVPAAFFVILNALILISYVFLAAKIFGKLGTEIDL